jgi:hypothetical protein
MSATDLITDPDAIALAAGTVTRLAVELDRAMARSEAHRAAYLAIYGIPWVPLTDTSAVTLDAARYARSLASTVR